MLGRELIIDVEDIEEYSILETIDGIRPLMEKIIENCKLNVVGKCEHPFMPYGATMLYLLSESHLTIQLRIDLVALIYILVMLILILPRH